MQIDLTGQQLGVYHLTRLLGTGGMASVYAAQQESVGREVAIKVLPAHLVAQSSDYVERFKREVKVAASLEHPHILPIYDYGVHNNISYVVMRLMAGGMLSTRIQRGRIPLADILKIIRQTGAGLDFAHRRGIVHRDLKASNILFDEEENAYLADFGIAKVLWDATKGLTGTGMVLGTPAYMAPEQWQAAEVDGRTDIYAFGILAYQLLTDKMPFDAPTPYALMHKHLHETPAPPTQFYEGLPPLMNDVVARAMAKNPNDRYPTVSALLEDLDRISSGTASLPKPPSQAPKEVIDPPTVTPTPPTFTRTEPKPLMEDSPTQSTPLPSPVIERKNSRPLILAGIGLILIVVLGAAYWLNENQDNPQLGAAIIPTFTETPSNTPTFTETPSHTPTFTETPSNTPTFTETPSNTPTFTETPSNTPTFTETPSHTPTFTETPSNTPTFTETPSHTPTFTETSSNTPTFTETPSNTPTFTETPSHTPTFTETPSFTPSHTVTPIPTEVSLLTAVTRNDDWQPLEQEFDGVEMMFVPAGCFMMGSTNGDNDERPLHQQCFDEPFWIDRYEVTNAQFDRLGGQANKSSKWDEPNTPRETITWREAKAFCEMRGGRLPTEAEFEYVSRGPDNLTYPWGHLFVGSNVVHSGNSNGQTQAVGTHPNGVSWVGANDLSGNVWEWLNTRYYPYPYDARDGREEAAGADPVIRGGSWTSADYKLRLTYREIADVNYADEYIGFRCARKADTLPRR